MKYVGHVLVRMNAQPLTENRVWSIVILCVDSRRRSVGSGRLIATNLVVVVIVASRVADVDRHHIAAKPLSHFAISAASVRNNALQTQMVGVLMVAAGISEWIRNQCAVVVGVVLPFRRQHLRIIDQPANGHDIPIVVHRAVVVRLLRHGVDLSVAVDGGGVTFMRHFSRSSQHCCQLWNDEGWLVWSWEFGLTAAASVESSEWLCWNGGSCGLVAGNCCCRPRAATGSNCRPSK